MISSFNRQRDIPRFYHEDVPKPFHLEAYFYYLSDSDRIHTFVIIQSSCYLYQK